MMPSPKTVQVAMSVQEFNTIEYHAKQADSSISKYIRETVLAVIAGNTRGNIQSIPESTSGQHLVSTLVKDEYIYQQIDALWLEITAIKEVNTQSIPLNVDSDVASNVDLVNTPQTSRKQVIAAIDVDSDIDSDVVWGATQVNTPDTTLEPGTILPTEKLLERLKQGILAQSNVKTEKGRQNAVANFPQDLAKAKVAKVQLMTAKFDPNGLSWLPTDETRELWARQ
ncbi:hypothetical protein [uncultured Nostoc sp.]|uniref:hypothetical protein n=1 Tax=uncultured Nostoc sp. TaxID=340711 RepID=UPI0035CB4B36